MEVLISSRHTAVSPRLEAAVRAKIGQLDRYMEQLNTAEVHFDEARNPRIADRETCEVTLTGHGHHLRCKVNAPDALTAVDLAEAKLERQIRKLRTKLQKRHQGTGATIRSGFGSGLAVPTTSSPTSHATNATTGTTGTDEDSQRHAGDSDMDTHMAAGAGTSSEGTDDDTEEVEPELRIVKTKRFHLGPLSASEAALKMDLLGHGFFFFINSATGRAAVVYRRDDGAVGLIDEAG